MQSPSFANWQDIDHCTGGAGNAGAAALKLYTLPIRQYKY